VGCSSRARVCLDRRSENSNIRRSWRVCEE
jgi:hypothetical protein